jgi:hypothetical protein
MVLVASCIGAKKRAVPVLKEARDYMRVCEAF